MLKVSPQVAGLTLLLGAGGLPAWAASEAPVNPPLEAPVPAAAGLKCTLIPFDTAEVVGEKGHWRLRVTILKAVLLAGRTPTLVEVEYFMQPDYYRLVLLACPVVKPESHHLTVSDDGTRITFEEPIGVLGTKGIELEGGKLQKFDLVE